MAVCNANCDGEHKYLKEDGKCEICEMCTPGSEPIKVVSFHSFTTQVVSTPLRLPSGISVRLGSCRLGLDSESGQTNYFKIVLHSFSP